MRLSGVWPIALTLTLGAHSGVSRAEPLGPAFTYQGQLLSAGTPANGPHDFEFRLYDSLGGLGLVGGVVPLNDVDVVNGLFTVTLNAGDEFGASAFNGSRRWLEIRVDAQALSPRQEITPAPFALYAPSTSGFWSANGSHIFNSNTGNVGIGTTNPSGKLHVSGSGNDQITLHRPTTGFPQIVFQTTAGVNDSSVTYDQANDQMYLANGGAPRLVVNNSGDVGIGTTAPGARLDVEGPTVAIEGGGFTVGVRGYGAAGDGSSIGVHGIAAGGLVGQIRGIGVKGESNTNVGVLGVSQNSDGVVGQSSGANVTGVVGRSFHANGFGGHFFNAAGGIALDVAGRARVHVLEITGADLAEKFPSSECVEPGMVVEIDPDQAGQLRLSREAYNRRVAGVVSGAGGLSAGTILGNLPGFEDAPPIALSGRVWTYCDATEHAIEPGDLLTTSNTPGHAMKALDGEPAHGAILGKAMTALKQGERGLVLILVSLQ